jgi:pimeloyl-ACP methyl ester carboxylesterase
MSDTAPTEHTTTSADGTAIHYDVRGDGEPAIVLVHGWAMDRSIWDEEAPRLAGRRVVRLDLAGHGASGGTRRAWTIASLAADVVAVVDALSLLRVVLVGHSMGGPVVLEAARLLAARVAGIVLVDTLLDVAQRTGAAEVDAFARALEGDYPGVTRAMAGEYLFAPATPDAVRQRVLGQALALDPETSVALLRAAWSYDPLPALKEIQAPVRAVSADKYPTNLEGNRAHMPGYTAEIVAGSGHYPMLEQPARFHEALAAQLAALRA